MATTTECVVKRFDRPDETREFVDHGSVDMLELAGHTVGRAEFEPGWRWSRDVKPIAGTESCQASHLAYVLAGRMMVRMDDGAEHMLGAGDVCAIPPGHDAEVIGDEPCVMMDFGEIADYAKR